MHHDELDCATNAAVMYRAILDDAERLAGPPPAFDVETSADPEAELRRELPWLLAWLSPTARAMLADHLEHHKVMVAFVHRAERHVTSAASNRS